MGVSIINLQVKLSGVYVLVGSIKSLILSFSHLEGVSATAAAAAKSFQFCPTLCDPIYGSPAGSSVHRILKARILEWVAISFSGKGFQCL